MAGKQLEKILSLYHARDCENAPIFDFKQSDGKLYQSWKEGGYGGLLYDDFANRDNIFLF